MRKILADEFELVEYSHNTSLLQILSEVDIFWFRLKHKIDKTVLSKLSRCKYLVTPVTGLDHIDVELCDSLGVKIICLQGENEFLSEVRATAEHTIGLALLLMRKYKDAIDHTLEGNWRRDLFRGNEFYGKTVGIIGYGRLGKITGDYFKSFGCNIGFFDIREKKHSQDVKKYHDLDSLLEASDIVSIHVPLDESTRGLLDATSFEKMKKEAIIINTSRGAVIDEDALLNALDNSEISGAALDVLEGEPVIDDNKLLKYARLRSNLVITPHIGGNTYESFSKTEEFIAKKLLAAVHPN